MSKVEKIEADLQQLSPAELRQVRDWLDDWFEDKLQFTSEFEGDIEESERELKAGLRPRVRRP
jgi:hypothetical protein